MSNETKETAVEWLYLEIYKFLNGKSEFQDANDILQQAKEMEKEQTIKTSLFWSHSTVKRKDIEDYYNETYGGNK